MKLNKKGMSEIKIEKMIMVFVLVLVLFKVIANLFPSVTDAGQELNNSGFPLAEFFTADGILWYLVAIAVLFLVWKSFTRNK